MTYCISFLYVKNNVFTHHYYFMGNTNKYFKKSDPLYFNHSGHSLVCGLIHIMLFHLYMMAILVICINVCFLIHIVIIHW